MRKKNIVVLLGLAFLQGMCFYSPIATLYRQAAGVTIFQMSVIESISFVLSLLMEVPWGIAADRIGYRKTMVLCTALFFVSKIIFWRAVGFGMFLLERVLLAIVIAGLSGVDASILWLSAGEEKAQRVFGLYSAFGKAGMIVAAVVCAVFVGENYRLSGFLTVLSYGAATLLVFFLHEVKGPGQTTERAIVSFKRNLRQFFRTRGLLPFILCGALSGEVFRNIGVFYNQLQYVRCGMNERAIAVVYTLETLVMLCGAFSAAVTKRVGTRRSGLIFLGMMAACCLVLAATANALLSVAAMLLMCLASALYGPLESVMQNRFVVSEDRATALSVNTLIYDGVAISLNPLLGRLVEAALPGAFLFCAVLCAASMGLFYRASATPAAGQFQQNA